MKVYKLIEELSGMSFQTANKNTKEDKLKKMINKGERIIDLKNRLVRNNVDFLLQEGNENNSHSFARKGNKILVYSTCLDILEVFEEIEFYIGYCKNRLEWLDEEELN